MSNKNKLISEKVEILLSLIKEEDEMLSTNPLEGDFDDGEEAMDDSLTAQKAESDSDSKLLDVIRKLVELSPEQINDVANEIDTLVSPDSEETADPFEEPGDELPLEPDMENGDPDAESEIEPGLEPDEEDEIEGLNEDATNVQIGTDAAGGLIELIKLLRRVFSKENAEQIKQLLQGMADGAGSSLRNEDKTTANIGASGGAGFVELVRLLKNVFNKENAEKIKQALQSMVNGAGESLRSEEFYDGTFDDDESIEEPEDEEMMFIKGVNSLGHSDTKAMMDEMMKCSECQTKMMETFVNEGFIVMNENDNEDTMVDTYNTLCEDEYTCSEMMESIVANNELKEELFETYMNMFQSASTLGEKPGLGNDGEMHEEVFEQIVKESGIGELTDEKLIDIFEGLYHYSKEYGVKNGIVSILKENKFRAKRDLTFDSLSDNGKLVFLTLEESFDKIQEKYIDEKTDKEESVLNEEDIKDTIKPVKGDNVDEYNKENANLHIDKALARVEATQETQEEKVEDLKNQKYIKPEDAVEETDVHRGKSPADVDMGIEDEAFDTRIELEMSTGDSRPRDEKEMGEKANVGGNSGDPYTVSPTGDETEGANAGELEVEKRKARKDHRDNEKLYAKEEQPVEELNETLQRMQNLMGFKFKDNSKKTRINETRRLMKNVGKKMG